MDVCPQLPDIAQGYGCTTYTFEVPWANCPSGRFHAGIDLWDSNNPTLQGQPVYATRAGVITMLGQNSVLEGHDFGPNAVCLRTDEGPVIWYGHLSVASVAVGDRVSVGTKIGEIGSLGVSTGPHLHFEVRDNFPDPSSAYQVVVGSIDPTPYLSNPQGVDTADNMPSETVFAFVPTLKPDDLALTVNTRLYRGYVSVRGKDNPGTATGRIVFVGYDGGPIAFKDFSVSNGALQEWDLPDNQVGNIVCQTWTGNASAQVKIGNK